MHPTPVDALLEMSGAFLISRAVQTAAELGIADLVATTPRTLHDLAHATGTLPDPLRRLLRLLVAYKVLQQNTDGLYSATPLSAVLESDHEDSVRALFQLGYRLTYRMLDDPLITLTTGQPSFNARFKVAFFDYLAQHSDDSAVFNRAMTSFTRRAARAVAAAYDFATAGHLADIGGGQGTLLAEILTTHPAATGTLYDQAHLAQPAREYFAARGLLERTTIVSGDFFTSVPVADTYLLSWVLHDWNDEQAITILRRCHETQTSRTGRVLVIEAILPEQPGPGIATFLDLVMLFGLGGQERTETEYVALLSKAGYSHTRTWSTHFAGIHVIEARHNA